MEKRTAAISEKTMAKEVRPYAMSGSPQEMNISYCEILGMRIAAINMATLMKWTVKNVSRLSGKYVCVANVYTVVIAWEDAAYLAVQNGSALTVPDGAPLSVVGRHRGFIQMARITGPDYMNEVFRISAKNGYRHYFYGSTPETQQKIRTHLEKLYPGLIIAGMESPPFRPLTEEEDQAVVARINEANADFVWIALGAPRQERWMAAHQDRVRGLMVGVGAGFDYLAGNIHRAPRWMQAICLEWLWRLIQEPNRLWGRYWRSNTKFLWLMLRGK